VALDAKPKHRATDGDHRGIVTQGLLVAGREAASLLEQVECTLDGRSSLVHLLVESGRGFPIRFGRDHRDSVPCVQVLTNRIGVVRLVAKQTMGLDRRDERRSTLAVVPVASGDLEGNGQT